MRIVLLGLVVLSVGISLMAVLVCRLPTPGATSRGCTTPPLYSLGDIFDICSEARAVEQKRERHAMIHQELEQAVAAVWADEQSLREAARQRRQLIMAQAPDYDISIQSMYPGASAEEAYARSLLSLLYAHAKDSPNQAAARARYAELLEQFRQEFHTEKDLLMLAPPPASPASSSAGSYLPSPVDCCP